MDRVKPVGKNMDYYRADRSELCAYVADLGINVGPAVLNVGCASGMDAQHLRGAGATTLHGIEPVTAAAAEALDRYDQVANCSFEAYEWDGTEYDWVIFADVLEHMSNPGDALATVRGWLRPGGHLLLSVPNVRHISVLWGLIVRGDWRYGESGILDTTHVRFFTSRSVCRLLEVHSFIVRDLRLWGKVRVGRAVARSVPRSGEFLLSQIFVVAESA